MDVPKKRSRSENWVPEDKILLKNLVEERIRVIENGGLDLPSIRQKQEAWKSVEKSFNSNCRGVHRTVQQLRVQWGNIKAHARKLTEKNKSESGGSCSVKSEEESENEDISFDHSDFDNINEIIIELPPQVDDASEVKDNSPSKRLEHGPASLPDNITNEKIQLTPAEEIAATEIKCRKELHAIQMENEKQIHVNLKLKQRLLIEKIKFYKDRNT